tara:strand:- start:277 stop:903 length:627 start_codon:yes stop_codon:yes gene_type:complete
MFRAGAEVLGIRALGARQYLSRSLALPEQVVLGLKQLLQAQMSQYPVSLQLEQSAQLQLQQGQGLLSRLLEQQVLPLLARLRLRVRQLSPKLVLVLVALLGLFLCLVSLLWRRLAPLVQDLSEVFQLSLMQLSLSLDWRQKVRHLPRWFGHKSMTVKHQIGRKYLAVKPRLGRQLMNLKHHLGLAFQLVKRRGGLKLVALKLLLGKKR